VRRWEIPHEWWQDVWFLPQHDPTEAEPFLWPPSSSFQSLPPWPWKWKEQTLTSLHLPSTNGCWSLSSPNSALPTGCCCCSVAHSASCPNSKHKQTLLLLPSKFSVFVLFFFSAFPFSFLCLLCWPWNDEVAVVCCFPCCECASYVVEWNVISEGCPFFKPFLPSNPLTLPLLPLWTKHLLSISKLMQNLQRSYFDNNHNISHQFNFYNNHFYFYNNNNPYHNKPSIFTQIIIFTLFFSFCR